MASKVLLDRGVICLAILIGTQCPTFRPSVAQMHQPTATTETPKQRITISRDELSGTLASDTIKTLASH